MAHIDATIGKNEMGGAGTLSGAFMPAVAATHDVADLNRFGIEQGLGRESGHGVEESPIPFR
jgi:hypothetical protein